LAECNNEAAQKLADRHIKQSIGKAIKPISDEIKQYISTLIETEMPEVVPDILMLDIQDIVETALDFVEIYQTNTGVRIEVNLEGLTSLVESIVTMINHNPVFIEETLDFFNSIEFDTKVIEGKSIQSQDLGDNRIDLQINANKAGFAAAQAKANGYR
jgi:hypothetical protein